MGVFHNSLVRLLSWNSVLSGQSGKQIWYFYEWQEGAEKNERLSFFGNYKYVVGNWPMRMFVVGTEEGPLILGTSQTTQWHENIKFVHNHPPQLWNY